jgi:Zn-dependent metalloprotease
MKHALLSGLLLLVAITSYSQMKSPMTKIPRSDRPYRPEALKIEPWQPAVPAAEPNVFTPSLHQYGSLNFDFKPTKRPGLQVTKDPNTGLPIWIEGSVGNLSQPIEKQAFAYLETVQELLLLKQAAAEFQLVQTETDHLGQTHLRLQQIYKNVKVYGGEIWLHARNGQIDLFNGKYFPTPELTDVMPSISQAAAIERALQDISKITQVKTLSAAEQKLLPGKPADAELVIYHPQRKPDAGHLAWAVTLHPNLTQHWLYFVDAKTGAILHQFSQICRLHSIVREQLAADHAEISNLVPSNPQPSFLNPQPWLPPRTAVANDLFNLPRTLNTWQQGSTYYLIDASRPMFNPAASTFPDEPTGVIWTIDALFNSPQRDNFEADHVRSNNNTWTNRTSVSAHYNAGRAYEYFLQTFGRNSINGRGGNIISLINVVDEDSTALDNAFWNGAAIFYGNGNRAFTAPLAKALDVAGHELSHGVIQNTANLEYQNESGALNESFADIFGAMIDRDDWQVGEDVVSRTFFPTGALRDLSNPNNGGTRLSDRGYQPASVAQQYRGTEDNGGVHINSGIPNRAYYLFATAANVGKDKAERVFYRALTTYLTRSSEFIDLRLAVLRAAADLYGNAEVTAATNAFNTVGIVGTTSSNTPTDLRQNPGSAFILYSNGDQTNLSIVTPAGNVVADELTDLGVLSKPSVTDDGSVVVYIDGDQRMQALLLDWQQGMVEELTLSNATIWRNVAISKDGSKIAALTDDYDNTLYIYDFTSQRERTYELYNPTYTEGITTGNVAYADALEWDYSGENVLYDALSFIPNAGDSIAYWDIGFIRVWNNAARNFGDGFISKLFTGLPENVSIGNPTFSKRSPYIIAFDYVDDLEETYSVVGTNIETGDVGEIYPNTDLGYPNYSTDDRQLIFDGYTTTDDPVVGIVNLATDKINAAANPPAAQVLLRGNQSGARWGVWFANGRRQLTDNEVFNLFDQRLEIFPNPFTEIVYLRGAFAKNTSVTAELFDAFGQGIARQTFDTGTEIWQKSFELRNLPPGTYVCRVSAGASSVSRKLIKL